MYTDTRPPSRHLYFGGSFFPPHLGHAQILSQALQKDPAATLHIVPTPQNPLKNSPGGAFNLIQAWLKDLKGLLSQSAFQRCHLETLELKAKSQPYTVSTLRQLRTGDQEWTLILGADSVVNFHLWMRPLEILEQITRLWVVPRTGAPDQLEILAIFKKLKPSLSVEFLKPVTDISSSALRKMDNQGSYLSPCVLREWQARQDLASN